MLRYQRDVDGRAERDLDDDVIPYDFVDGQENDHNGHGQSGKNQNTTSGNGSMAMVILPQQGIVIF